MAAVATAISDPNVSERRFRSNIAIEGLKAWEEQEWVERKVQIGAVQFEVVRLKQRCLATHANPKTGERDLPMLNTLTKVIGQEKPLFAVAILPTEGCGEIHVGDEVLVID